MPNATSAMPAGKGTAPVSDFRVIYHEPICPDCGSFDITSDEVADRRRPHRNRAHLPRLRHRMAPRLRHRLDSPAMTARVAELDALTGRGMFLAFYDPDGSRYGLPTYPYHWAPAGLLTLRQLRAKGLRPGGQDITAQILWRHRRQRRVAYLYREALALPKRRPARRSSPRSPRRSAPGAPAPPAGPRSPTTSPGRSANASTAPP